MLKNGAKKYFKFIHSLSDMVKDFLLFYISYFVAFTIAK